MLLLHLQLPLRILVLLMVASRGQRRVCRLDGASFMNPGLHRPLQPTLLVGSRRRTLLLSQRAWACLASICEWW